MPGTLLAIDRFSQRPSGRTKMPVRLAVSINSTFTRSVSWSAKVKPARGTACSWADAGRSGRLTPAAATAASIAMLLVHLLERALI